MNTLYRWFDACAANLNDLMTTRAAKQSAAGALTGGILTHSAGECTGGTWSQIEKPHVQGHLLKLSGFAENAFTPGQAARDDFP